MALHFGIIESKKIEVSKATKLIQLNTKEFERKLYKLVSLKDDENLTKYTWGNSTVIQGTKIFLAIKNTTDNHGYNENRRVLTYVKNNVVHSCGAYVIIDNNRVKNSKGSVLVTRLKEGKYAYCPNSGKTTSLLGFTHAYNNFW